MTTTTPFDEPDELLALFLDAAYDLFEDERLGDGTWDSHVTHEARTFATSELRMIADRLEALADAAGDDAEVAARLEALEATVGPWSAEPRAGLRHTATLVRGVLHERSAAR